MKARKTWILIANGTTARILENTGPGKGLQALADKAWRAPQKDAYESEQGMTNSSVGRSKHRMAPHNAPDKEEVAFAEELAERLSKAHADGAFDDLVLTAAPKMLGMLRPALDAQVRGTVIAELPKDLVKTPEADLKAHFDEVLRL
ncbi:host attachment protein [Profundibacter sp.]